MYAAACCLISWPEASGFKFSLYNVLQLVRSALLSQRRSNTPQQDEKVNRRSSVRKLESEGPTAVGPRLKSQRPPNPDMTTWNGHLRISYVCISYELQGRFPHPRTGSDMRTTSGLDVNEFGCLLSSVLEMGMTTPSLLLLELAAMMDVVAVLPLSHHQE